MPSKYPTAEESNVRYPDRPVSFFVTVEAVIGEVTLDEYATQSAHEAAFSLIARNDTPGVYKFPMADGRTCVVEVAYQEPVFHD